MKDEQSTELVRMLLHEAMCNRYQALVESRATRRYICDLELCLLMAGYATPPKFQTMGLSESANVNALMSVYKTISAVCIAFNGSSCARVEGIRTHLQLRELETNARAPATQERHAGDDAKSIQHMPRHEKSRLTHRCE